MATFLDGGLGVALAVERHLDGKMPGLSTESGYYFMVSNNSLGHYIKSQIMSPTPGGGDPQKQCAQNAHGQRPSEYRCVSVWGKSG